MTNQGFEHKPYTQNRELSWLRFNDSVLDEATNESNPLLERLKFISIFTSNLDEFFMIRVGSLHDLESIGSTAADKRSGMSPGEQLKAIYSAVRPLYKKRAEILRDVEEQLGLHGIYRLSYGELEAPELKFVKQFYRSAIEPILSPQIIDHHHPFPHLQSKVVHVGARLRRKEREVLALIPLPSSLPDIVRLPGADFRYILTEDILERHLDSVFSPYSVMESTSFCVTRNADVNPDDEAFDFGGDFRGKMKKVIDRRRRLPPVRLEYSKPASGALLEQLESRLGITSEKSYLTSGPLKMKYVFEIASALPENKSRVLLYSPFEPRISFPISPAGSVLRNIQQRDILLSYPYESIEPFLRLVRDSASDPNVISIKITIYRLASRAKLVDYLCAAAENGKDVTVLIELRARFDEENNINWSERLENAGCTVIYGFEEFKVHSKICLITRKERGDIRFITQIGTGNYNEKTAAMYTDLCLMTCDGGIGRDANEFFKNMAIGNLEGKYRSLIVAPAGLKPSILSEIDREISRGTQGCILIKINSLTDLDIIEKLKQASCAGVRITMIIRGICCLLPGIPEKTENIRIISIVGRFLEHSRVYCFGSGDEERMYIASADFMTRNMVRRVELAAPVKDKACRKKIHDILDACLKDTVKARHMTSDGTYERLPAPVRFDCQQYLLEQAAEEPELRAVPLYPGMRGFFRRIFRKQ